MKKIISLIVILIIIISLVSNVYAVSSCKVSLQIEKGEISNNSEVIVNVNLSKIQDENGIFGISAVLKYDEKSLEYIEMEGQEGWETPTYYEDSGIVILLRDKEYATTDQTVCKIKFKIIDANQESMRISLEDIVASNGDIDITLGETSENVKDEGIVPILPEPTEPTTPEPSNPEPINPQPVDPTPDEGTSGNEEVSNISTPASNADSNIPYAGAHDNISIILWIIAFIMLATASFIQIKCIEIEKCN